MELEGILGVEFARSADVATWIGLVFTVVAFGVALYALKLAFEQLDRTQTAVESAQLAEQEALKESALRQILLLLPSMAEIENSLRAAVGEKSVSATERELANWRQRGSELQGMLKGRADVSPELVTDLRNAIAQASLARNRLGDGEIDLRSVTKLARRDIGEAVAGLTGLSGEFRAQVGEEVEGDVEDE